MRPITDVERRRWMYGTGKDHETISHQACGGRYACDHCGEPSSAIGHKGNGTPVVVRCAECFKADLERDRANRPSRAELIARVNAAIGQ